MSIEIVDGASASEPVLGADEELKGRSPRELAWRRFRRNKVGIIAGVFTLGTLLSSLFAPFICKVLGLDPNELHLDQINVSTGLPKAYLNYYCLMQPLSPHH